MTFLEQRQQKGFTLIELMVTLSIISLLSSILTISLNGARLKARNTRKIAEASAVKSAMDLYYADTGKQLPMYSCPSININNCYFDPARTAAAIEDVDHYTFPTTEAGRSYYRSMQELVDKHYLTSIPHSPDATPYTYFDYGPPIGPIFSVTLVSPSPNQQPKLECQIQASCTEPVSGSGALYCTYVGPTPPEADYDARRDCWYETDTHGNVINWDEKPGCYQPPTCVQGSNQYCSCSSFPQGPSGGGQNYPPDGYNYTMTGATNLSMHAGESRTITVFLTYLIGEPPHQVIDLTGTAPTGITITPSVASVDLKDDQTITATITVAPGTTPDDYYGSVDASSHDSHTLRSTSVHIDVLP
jgi:prepilin-type N-terminal cleavage/methylation domain-containing protein